MTDLLFLGLIGVLISLVIIASVVFYFSKKIDNNNLSCPECGSTGDDIRLVSEVKSGNELKSTYKCCKCGKLIRKNKEV